MDSPIVVETYKKMKVAMKIIKSYCESMEMYLGCQQKRKYLNTVCVL